MYPIKSPIEKVSASNAFDLYLGGQRSESQQGHLGVLS
jgi:hypothetical protein